MERLYLLSIYLVVTVAGNEKLESSEDRPKLYSGEMSGKNPSTVNTKAVLTRLPCELSGRSAKDAMFVTCVPLQLFVRAQLQCGETESQCCRDGRVTTTLLPTLPEGWEEMFRTPAFRKHSRCHSKSNLQQWGSQETKVSCTSQY